MTIHMRHSFHIEPELSDEDVAVMTSIFNVVRSEYAYHEPKQVRSGVLYGYLWDVAHAVLDDERGYEPPNGSLSALNQMILALAYESEYGISQITRIERQLSRTSAQ